MVMIHTIALSSWADQEVGHAKLGDFRCTRRLVQLLAACALAGAGTVTAVCKTDAERQAAYDFLENQAIQPQAIADGIHQATANRCRPEPFVFVPIDGTSLKLANPHGRKDFGSIGTRKSGARGLKVINAMAVNPDGVPLGLTAQVYWNRTGDPARKGHQKRRVEDKETRHWLAAMQQSHDVLHQQAPETKLCFLLDREGDSWPVFAKATALGCDLIVRANHNRRLRSGASEYLWPVMTSKPLLGTYELDVVARPDRQRRTATMAVRAAPVLLDLKDKRTDRHLPSAHLQAVHAVEISRVPEGEKPIEWLLLTTLPADGFDDACAVVWSYAQRWRIEEFHRTWKSGQSNVEQTQLHSQQAVLKWAAIQASVAMRSVRLAYLAQRQPDLPATVACVFRAKPGTNSIPRRAVIPLEGGH